jgi:PhoPQ-activated pathogenicity-related protein
MPKLVLLGANDPYWVVDSVRRYWEVLPEPKTLRILPNVGHGVLGERAAEDAIVSFVRAVLHGQPQPQLTWRFSGRAGDVALLSGEVEGGKIARCTIWEATASTLDFRSARFTPTECQMLGAGRHFRGEISLESREHRAVFGELELVAVDGRVTVVSTGTQVYPRLK